MRILVVEDERALCDAIARSLRNLAYSVDCCYDGQQALDLLDIETFDLVVLDLNLPHVDGMTVLRQLRTTDCETKVLVLSARGEVADKVAGLDAGANDYLTKPFSTGELLARIRALTRRKGEVEVDCLHFAELQLNRQTYDLIQGETRMKLSLKEYQIMEMLLSNPEQIIPKERFIEKIWGYESDVEYNNIEVYISFLRKKLTAIHSTVQIRTARGIGYFLEKKV